MNEGESLFAWMIEYPDRTNGLISAVADFGLGKMNTILIGRSREPVEKIFGTIARDHGRKMGHPVWLREFTGCVDHIEERTSDERAAALLGIIKNLALRWEEQDKRSPMHPIFSTTLDYIASLAGDALTMVERDQ